MRILGIGAFIPMSSRQLNFGFAPVSGIRNRPRPKANMDHAAFERADDRIQAVMGEQDYRGLGAGGYA
jgi:hypothetical protein